MHATKLLSFFLLRMILQGLVLGTVLSSPRSVRDARCGGRAAGQFVDEIGEPGSQGPTDAAGQTLVEQEERRR